MDTSSIITSFINANSRLESKLRELTIRNEELEKKIKKYELSAFRTEYFSSEVRTKQRILKNIRDIFSNINEDFCQSKVNLSIKSVQITEKNEHNFSLDKNFVNISKEEKYNISKVLYTKDKLLLADKKYASIRSDLDLHNLPSLDELYNYRTELNNSLRSNLVKPTSSSIFTDIVAKINNQCRLFLSNLNDKQLNETTSLKIKLSADGTRCGRNLNLINFTFQLIDVIKLNKSPSSVFNVRTVGLAECRENYDEINTIFDYISLCLNVYSNIDYIEYSGKRIKIELFFVADWKLTACVLGLEGANSNYPCIWCHWKKPKPKRVDGKESNAPRQLPNSNLRNEEDRQQFKGKAACFGYKNKNLLPNIKFQNILLDTLHLKLRVADRLLERLINGLAGLDYFESGSINSSHKNLTKWVSFINDDCKIRRRVNWFSTSNSAGITSDFDGREYDKIFEMINIPRDFPSLKNADDVQALWKSLYDIINSLDKLSSDEIQQKTERWHSLFIATYKKEFETPYIHALQEHLHDQVALHGDISIFNQQPVEKLNDLTTKEYFQATNKHEFLEQILLRRERMDFYQQNNNLLY